jgi:hypothetical protein
MALILTFKSNRPTASATSREIKQWIAIYRGLEPLNRAILLHIAELMRRRQAEQRQDATHEKGGA